MNMYVVMQGAKTDKNLRYLLQKVLKQSDVGSLGRIVSCCAWVKKCCLFH